MLMNRKKTISNYLTSHHYGGYLWIDYEGKHPLVPLLFPHAHLTRKLFGLFLPNGKLIVLAQELDALLLKEEENSDVILETYLTWQEMKNKLAALLSSISSPILMDYSEDGLLMPISLADYGTVSFAKKLGHEVSSSSSLLGLLSSYIEENEFLDQRRTANLLLQIKDEAFELIRQKIANHEPITEYDVQSYIVSRFEKEHLLYDEAPIVATGKNARSPHYSPTKIASSPLEKGDLVLIDMWAKSSKTHAVYGDITWMAYIGSTLPNTVEKRFSLIRHAADACFAFIKECYGTRPIYGYEADEVTRKVIEEGGYGKYFSHRTGHSIAYDEGPHGKGTNLDNFETHDDRELLNGTSFSIEPGIYAEDFGMRLETDVAIHNHVPEIIAGRQDKIILLD